LCRLCSSYGGWIIDGFPVNSDQWSLLLEQGKILPDNVIFLQDESPNGNLLIQRWYDANKDDVNEEIEGYCSRCFFDQVTVFKHEYIQCSSDCQHDVQPHRDLNSLSKNNNNHGVYDNNTFVERRSDIASETLASYKQY